MDKKEISIDPSLFGYGGGKKGKKGTSSKSSEKKKKEMLVNVNGGSVKELLLRKLREYKKNKTKKLVQHHDNNNQSKVNPDFLERIKKRKNKTENSINMGYDDNLFKNVQNTYQNKNPEGLENTLRNYNHENTETINNHVEVHNAPPFGIMKNGNLPTYRTFHNRTMKKSNDNMFTQQDKTRQNTIEDNPPTTKKERVKLKIERKLKVGRNKTSKKCGVFIRNNVSRKNIEEYKVEMKKHHMRTIKNHLKRNNLIKHGCSAPNDLLREIYENSRLIGDVDNKNSKNMVHNYFEDNAEE
jgi:hypothetical protein